MVQIKQSINALPKTIRIGGQNYVISSNKAIQMPLNHAINIWTEPNLIIELDNMDKADIGRLSNYKLNQLIKFTDGLQEGDTASQVEKILFPKKVKASPKPKAKKAPAKKAPAKKAKKVETPKKETPTEEDKEVVA